MNDVVSQESYRSEMRVSKRLLRAAARMRTTGHYFLHRKVHIISRDDVLWDVAESVWKWCQYSEPEVISHFHYSAGLDSPPKRFWDHNFERSETAVTPLSLPLSLLIMFLVEPFIGDFPCDVLPTPLSKVNCNHYFSFIIPTWLCVIWSNGAGPQICLKQLVWMGLLFRKSSRTIQDWLMLNFFMKASHEKLKYLPLLLWWFPR